MDSRARITKKQKKRKLREMPADNKGCAKNEEGKRRFNAGSGGPTETRTPQCGWKRGGKKEDHRRKNRNLSLKKSWVRAAEA